MNGDENEAGFRRRWRRVLIVQKEEWWSKILSKKLLQQKTSNTQNKFKKSDFCGPQASSGTAVESDQEYL